MRTINGKTRGLEVIPAWFETVHATIQRHGILGENTYDYDETGFTMGLTVTANVISRSEYYGLRSVVQPEIASGNYNLIN